MHQITPIKAFKDNYIWSICNPSTGYCVIVDPGEAEPVLQYLKDNHLKLEAILITHHHSDHTGGLHEILEKYPVPVYSTKTMQTDSIEMPHIKMNFKMIPVPGHTLDHIAFYSPGVVFCGDSLFTAGCGRVFEGTYEQMYASLQKLASLPDDTLVYCGHEYTEANLKFAKEVEPNNVDLLKRIESTMSQRKKGLPTVPAPISLEKKTNPFLRVMIPSVIKAAELHANRPLKTPEQVFQVVREWKDKF